MELVGEIREELANELETLRRRVAELEKRDSERKRAEEQLIIADRLASLGEMASGIAHELNNPLTSVIGFSQLLLARELPDDIREDIGVIYSEAQRTAEVMKNLLTFARRHAPVKQLVNINSVIKKVLNIRAYEEKVENIQVITAWLLTCRKLWLTIFSCSRYFSTSLSTPNISCSRHTEEVP